MESQSPYAKRPLPWLSMYREAEITDATYDAAKKRLEEKLFPLQETDPALWNTVVERTYKVLDGAVAEIEFLPNAVRAKARLQEKSLYDALKGTVSSIPLSQQRAAYRTIMKDPSLNDTQKREIDGAIEEGLSVARRMLLDSANHKIRINKNASKQL